MSDSPTPNGADVPYGWEFSTLRAGPGCPPGYIAHLELDSVSAGQPVWVWLTSSDVRKLIHRGLEAYWAAEDRTKENG